MGKHLPANAGDLGSIPGPGRFQQALGQLSPCTTTTEAVCRKSHMLQLLKPECLEPVLCNKKSHPDEKPEHCNRVALACCN